MKKEFEEFLRCGILAYGFLRLKCGECKTEKLVALVPPPRAHLTRFHGILAPHAKNRSKVVPKKKENPETKESEVAKKTNRISWAKLLKRVFQIDVESASTAEGS